VHALLRVGGWVGPAFGLGSAESLGADVSRLEFLADRVRVYGPEHAGDVRDALVALAGRVLLPLLGRGGATAERLHLVLDPGVPDIPWESLPHRGGPLAGRVALLRVPCLSVRRPPRAVGARTSFFALGDADLPGVRREEASLGRDARLFTGEAATVEALSDALARPGVVHVAGHGLVAPAAPPLGGIRLADRWYSALDVPKEVEADVVVLASCRTGVEAGTAAQAWGGLPAAVLAAGARRVVWTAADVDDDAVARVTSHFHAKVRRLGAERAFGAALEEAGADPRVAACLLPFRLSGVGTQALRAKPSNG
jgi:hypothetical protein